MTGKNHSRRTSGAALAQIALLCSALWGAQAAAQDTGHLAALAASVHGEHCSAVAAGRATAAAEAMAAVTPVLAALSRAHDQSADPSLLYWRGVLNQCLDQGDRAGDRAMQGGPARSESGHA